MEALTASWLGDGAGGVLGWTLVHSLWQAALVAGGLTLVLRIVPSAMSRVRTAAAAAALGLLIVLGAATWTGLHADWRQHAACWRSGEYAVEHPAVCMSHGVTPPESARARELPKRRAVLPWAWIALGDVPLVGKIGAAARQATADVSLVVLLGGVVSLVALIRLLIGVFLLRGVVRRSEPLADGRAGVPLVRIGERLGVSRAVELRESSEIGAPAVAACRRPIILLPRGMCDALEPKQLECVLSHEMVHVRRRHFAANLVQRALECLIAWNPFGLWISRRIREEREVLCDDVAAGLPAADRRCYVETLLRLERLRTPAGPALVGLLGEGSLVRRVRRLAGPPPPGRGERLRRSAAAGIAASLTLFIVIQVSVAAMALSSSAVMNHDLTVREEPPVATASSHSDRYASASR